MSLGGLPSLKTLDVENCSLAELPTITDCHALQQLRCKRNPLQRPPVSVASHGIDAIRRYFRELEAEGATISRAARLVLLGDGMAGKTSLQRGLKSGGSPSPTAVDARTIQLDISELTLLEGDKEHEPVTFSVWDLGGQVAYAAAQQPYIAPGSLYLLVVPSHRASDEHFADVIGRWLCYLQAGAPAAYVLPVLTQCDRLLPPGAPDRSPAALDRACAEQASWVRRCIYWHQCRLGSGATRLRFHEGPVICVSSVNGGDASLLRLRTVLEGIATASPPLLLSIGQTIPRSWSCAVTALRALRDGRDPVASARAAKQQLDAKSATAPVILPAAIPSLARPYITLSEAQQKWCSIVAPALGLNGSDPRVLHDALQLLVNQGEIFASCGCIYLQPAHVTRLLKPLVDHRLDREWALPRAYEHTNELYEESPAVKLLLSAVDVLRQSGELREELLPMLWEDCDLHVDDFGAVLLMLSESGVLFLSEHTSLGRRWVMPMRLPDKPPESLATSWAALQNDRPLTLSYPLRLAPPGLVERLMASCYGLGYYHQFWRKGALIRAKAVDDGALLIELRGIDRGDGTDESAPPPSTMTAGSPLVDGEAPPPMHRLVCEFRGPADAFDDLVELLVQVRLRADRLLRDFPGLGEIEGEVRGADASATSAASAAPSTGTHASLSLSADTAASSQPYSRLKFLGHLKFGRPIEAGMGLHRLLGLADADDVQTLVFRGEEALTKEMGTISISFPLPRVIAACPPTRTRWDGQIAIGSST